MKWHKYVLEFLSEPESETMLGESMVTYTDKDITFDSYVSATAFRKYLASKDMVGVEYPEILISRF